ncbi:MAG: cytochrome c-type biogenesis protein CcmH [Truepera sp.]|nr:cytochrome c-type biogenesis protein CcmH [Truepera sp.]
MRVLALILIGLVSLGQAQEVLLDPRVFEIGRQLRCPTCIAETVADSAEGISGEMRLIIQEQLVAGKSEGEILAFFQERYGDWVLLDPPRRGIYLLVWASPVVVGLLAVVLLMIYIRRGQQQAAAPLDVSSDELERVRAALRQEG